MARYLLGVAWQSNISALWERSGIRRSLLVTFSGGIIAVSLAILALIFSAKKIEHWLVVAPATLVLIWVLAFLLGYLGHPVDALDARRLTLNGKSPAAAATSTLLTGFAQPMALLGLTVAFALVALLPQTASKLEHVCIFITWWFGYVIMHRLGTRVGRAVGSRKIVNEFGAVVKYLLAILVSLIIFALLYVPWQEWLDHCAETVPNWLQWVPAANLALLGTTPSLVSVFAVSSIAVLGLITLEWMLALRDGRRAMLSRTSGGKIELGMLRLSPASPTWVIAARTWLSWLRDARYRLMFVTVVLLPPVLLLPALIAGVPSEHLLLTGIPLFALFFGWALHNDIAYDSTALWLHVTGGLSGRDDRLGRAVPTLVTGSFLVLCGSVLIWLVTGSPQRALLVAMVSLALLGCGVGGSSIMSVISPYPVPAPGTSVWSQPMSTWGMAFAVQAIGLVLEVALCVPAILLAVDAIQSQSWGKTLLAAAVAAVTAVAVLVAGILLGGRLFTAKRTHLLNRAIRES